MKFVLQTTIRDLQDHLPVLSGRKEGNDSIFEYGKPLKLLITEDNIAFQFEVDADEKEKVEVELKKGRTLRITVETL